MENIPTLVRAVPEGIEVLHDSATLVFPRDDIAGTSWTVDMDSERNIERVYVSDARMIPSLLEPQSPFRHICEDRCSPDTTFYLSLQGRPTGVAIARMGNFLQMPECKVPAMMGNYDILKEVPADRSVGSKKRGAKDINFYELFMGKGSAASSRILKQDCGFEPEISLHAEEDGLIEDFYDDDVMVLSDDDLQCMLVEEIAGERTDMIDISEVTRVISYEDVTRVVDRRSYDTVRKRLFWTHRMDKKERIRLDYMKDVCSRSFDRLGFFVQETDMIGRQGYMVKQVKDRVSDPVCVPDFVVEDALRASESVDTAVARLDGIRQRHIPRVNTVVKNIEEITRAGDAGDVCGAKDALEREISDLVCEAKGCFIDLLQARDEARRYFVNGAAERTDTQIRQGLDMLSMMLLGDAVTGVLDDKTSAQVFDYMCFQNGLSEKAAAAREYRKLKGKNTFRSLDQARAVAVREFSDEHFFDEVMGQLDAGTRSLAYNRLSRAFRSDRPEETDNLLRVYSASGNSVLNRVAEYGTRIRRLLDRGTWQDLDHAKKLIGREMTGDVRTGMLGLVDSRIHDIVYDLAAPVADGTSARKGLLYSPEEKQRMYSSLVSAGTSGHAARALCIADRYLPDLRESTLRHLGTCLEKELSESDGSFIDHRERFAGLLDELDGMQNRHRRENAQHYVHLIAQSYMQGGKPRLVGSDPAQNKQTVVGIPCRKVASAGYPAGAA